MHPAEEMQQMMQEYEQQLEEAVIAVATKQDPQEAVMVVLGGLGLSKSIPHVLKEIRHAMGR